jgi:hypothetical protein
MLKQVSSTTSSTSVNISFSKTLGINSSSQRKWHIIDHSIHILGVFLEIANKISKNEMCSYLNGSANKICAKACITVLFNV